MTMRRWFVLATCAATAASSLYACGLDLEAGPSDTPEGGTSSGKGPGPSSSSSSSSGSSSGETSSSSSGEAGASSSSSGDASTTDGATCTTVTILPANVPCPPDDTTLSTEIDGHKVTCTRRGVVAVPGPAPEVLTADADSQELGLWVALPLEMSKSFTVEAVIDITGSGSVGAGFGIGFVNPDLDGAASVPTTGGAATLLGMARLDNFEGAAAVVQNYNNLHLLGITVPDLGFGQNPGQTTAPVTPQRYNLTVRHAAGPGAPLASLVAITSSVPVADVEVPIVNSAVETTSAFVGLTASTGTFAKSEQKLVSFTITTCD